MELPAIRSSTHKPAALKKSNRGAPNCAAIQNLKANNVLDLSGQHASHDQQAILRAAMQKRGGKNDVREREIENYQSDRHRPGEQVYDGLKHAESHERAFIGRIQTEDENSGRLPVQQPRHDFL
jgi:hypothetical protein